MNNDTITDGYRFVRNFLMAYGYRAQRADVEDVFQRAALRSLETGSSPDGANFYAYLKYSCLKFFRDDLPKANHDSLLCANSVAACEQHMQLSSILEDMEAIRPKIESLSPAQREAVLMEYWGMCPMTAAIASGRTKMAVYVARCCGVKTLRELMTEST